MGILDSISQGISDDVKYITNDVLGIKSAVANKKGTKNLPWDMNSSTPSKSEFLAPIQIDDTRWDQLYPYRLMVIDTSNNNQVVGGNPSSVSVSVSGGAGLGNSIVTFEPMGQKWLFKLPITPQQLSIVDQFAINTSATLRGVVEEHNGVKFKNIQASGTMGVWPYRESVVQPPTSPGLLRSFLGGTLTAVGNVVSQVGGLINTVTSGHPANKPVTTRPELSDAGATSTGYYQTLALEQFLEQYAEAKKDPANASWRLVFDMPKQNQSFVVTPMQFSWQQNATKPLEIDYAFQLKAWRRIDLGFSASAVQPAISPISTGLLQQILNTVAQARTVAAAAYDLIGAVRSDVEKPLEVLRQTSLFIKDLSGVAATAADLPSQIARDYSSSIKESLNQNSNQIMASNSSPDVRIALSNIQANAAQTEGLSGDAVTAGQLGTTAAQYNSIDPSNNVFIEPARNFELFDQVPLYSLSLTGAQQQQIDDMMDDIREITVDDLRSFRNTISDLALQISNYYGSGDSFYNQVYGKPAPKVRLQPMTLDEFEILDSLYDTMQAYDNLTATTYLDDIKKQSNMDYVAGLADQAGIEFSVPSSKIMVPVPFGLTMEQIAARYLGDAQRWLEIATLNNLREPYIDEDGFQLPLLSNATGRQITIGSIDNLYEGQRVILKSATQVPAPRRILSIDRLSDTSFLLSLDGEPNLDTFVLVDQAYLQAYLPGTVNSQQKFFIPSDQTVPGGPNIQLPPSVSSDPLVGLSQVDWLLTDSGDLATNTYGDFRLSAGLTNLIQAIKIKVGTSKGSILTHPDFGLGIKPGVLTSEVSAQIVYNSISALISDDPRFSGLASLQVQLNGPTLSISMSVILAGGQGVFPLTFDLTA